MQPMYDPLDLFGLRRLGGADLFGLRVIEAPEHARYTLPEEVIPGVPWPPGFRDEINRWSRSFLGTTCVVKPGEMLMIGGGMVVARPRDVALLINCV